MTASQREHSSSTDDVRYHAVGPRGVTRKRALCATQVGYLLCSALLCSALLCSALLLGPPRRRENSSQRPVHVRGNLPPAANGRGGPRRRAGSTVVAKSAGRSGGRMTGQPLSTCSLGGRRPGLVPHFAGEGVHEQSVRRCKRLQIISCLGCSISPCGGTCTFSAGPCCGLTRISRRLCA